MSASAVVSRVADHDAADVELVAAVRAGDDRAFEALYVRYQGRITSYVRGMVHDHGRAEDITQEVFMSALRRMRGTEAAIAFKPWIYEIAKNACIDAWRRSRNTNEVSFDAQDALGADDHGRLADPGLTPDSAVDNKDAIDNLCGAFGGLSPTHHEILVMREFEGLSYREIGERLGMSRPGVESTLFRARRRLSEEYEELVSGERCLRVQRIVDSPGGRATGLRDQRRMARHLSHCQPCRRYARLAGVDLDTVARPAAGAGAAAAAKIAACVPLPLFVRRRWGGEELVGPAHHGPVAQWSASIAGTLDPGTVSAWSKAAATAATVAVASLGAGAAIHEHRAIERFVGGSAPAARHAAPHGAGAAAAAGTRAAHRSRGDDAATASRAPAAPAGDRRAGAPGAAVVPVRSRRHSIAAGDAPGGAGATLPIGAKPDPAGHGGLGDATAPLTKLSERPAAAAPSPTPAGAPAELPLGTILDGLGATGSNATTDTTGTVGTTPATSTADGSTAPARPLSDAVTQAGGALGTLGATTATTMARPSSPPPSLAATATALVDSVSSTVTGTLASTTTGRTAP